MTSNRGSKLWRLLTYHALVWFKTETDEPERGRPGPKSVSVTLVPTEHKTNGAAPAMSPERRDALSAKDSPPGTDSGNQPGRIGSPDD